eukprot:scaffold34915_cov180-Amphora_coffeaeformis.AAC.4
MDQEDRPKESSVEYLTLTLPRDLGQLQIKFRPDLSSESVDYLKQLVDVGSCECCQFYRAEKPGILQGIVKSSQVPQVSKRGRCPPGFDKIPNDCPAWDKQCACHGPTMTRGMVAWAGGGTGPDFFINTYKEPVQLWGTQHTVFGELSPSSLKTLEKIWEFPTKRGEGGMTFLEEPLTFTLTLDH